MQRTLFIKDFRTFGINDYAKFEINSNSDDKLYGDLIILVGPNNSGKSNVLNAINALKSPKIPITEKPDFIYDRETSPEIKLVLEDEKQRLSYKISTVKATVHKQNLNDRETDLTKLASSIIGYVNATDMTNKTLSQGHISQDIFNINDINNLNGICNRSNDNWIIMLPYLIKHRLHIPPDSIKALRSAAQRGVINANISTILSSKITNYNNTLPQITEEELLTISQLENEFSCITINASEETLDGIKLLPNIITYTETEYHQRDFEIGTQNIQTPTMFFKNLFACLKIDGKEIIECYNQYVNNGNNAGILSKLEKKMNRSLIEVSKTFNSLYSSDSNYYEFKVKLESAKICFYIVLRDNDSEIPLTIDKQSSGFKWFFNFYFNVISSTELTKGDIILMDEPATNLHVNGVIELRNIIKDFALANGITFIVSTHSPFFVDIDNLDELRIIKRTGEESHIINKFFLAAENTENEHDTLFEVLSALTLNQIGNQLFLNPNKTLIFVEGITDYNYLIAFKKYLNFDKFIFLPVNGIGGTFSNEKLKNIAKHPILLVDADDAGQKVKKQADGTDIEVLMLNEIDENFITIESLFSKEDREKISGDNKSYKVSCEVKKFYKDIDKNFSAETINNFKKLLDNIAQ